MALGRYFSDLWAREEQPVDEEAALKLDDNQRKLLAEAFGGELPEHLRGAYGGEQRNVTTVDDLFNRHRPLDEGTYDRRRLFESGGGYIPSEMRPEPQELTPYKRQSEEAGMAREENQGYWSKLLGRLGMGGPEEEVPVDYGFGNLNIEPSAPLGFETASPESTLRPPVDRKELGRSGRNNSGILGALKKYAPLFGAATFDPRRRSKE